MPPKRTRSTLALCLFCVLLAGFLLPTLGRSQTAGHVVISQVYGGGGNSGTKYTNDYVELFNPTSTTLTLTGYSVQYASSTGSFSSANVTALPPAVTLAPGQFYLIQEAVGAGGTTPLPTADATGSLALSATAGKVALVSSTTALSGSCPTTSPTLVDFVGFGPATNCALGSPTAAPSNTTAVLRTNVCANAASNSADFIVGAPNPRNASTSAVICATGGPSPLVATGAATPSQVNTGSPVLFTVQVTPATAPTSTNITVQADLRTLGGFSTQPLYDDGTHGDLTAGDNIFSYSQTVSAAGAYSIPVTVSDAQSRTAAASIAFTAQIPPQTVNIRAIQSTKPSQYATQTVSTSGIVTGVKSNGFFLEAKDADTNPATPEGILIFTGSTTKPSFIVPGAEVLVTGTVTTYPAASLTPSTEINGALTFTLLTTGNPLPTPVTITSTQDSPTGGIRQFAPYEGMRVRIDSFTTTSGTDGTLNEMAETNISNGQFYGVVTGVPRPFREPGISITDTVFGPVPASVPLWDSNPELLLVDSLAFGGPAIDVTSNATLTGVNGVMDF